MNTSIVGRKFDLTEPIKEHIDTLVESLNKYNLEIISVKTIISADEKNGKKGFSVEFVVNLKNKNSVVITQKDKDVYAAADLAIERVKKVLRRHADKIKNKKHISHEEIDAMPILQSEKYANNEDEIVPMDLELHKPLEMEDAIKALKEDTKRQFIVFNDMESKLRIMYKRADGKFGLY
jgi:putative sigma-54 modulation protein